MLNYAIENTTSLKIGISCSFGYLYSIIILLNYMKKKDYKYELKTVLLYYNLVQIMLNIYIIYGTYYIISVPNIFAINMSYNDSLKYYVYLHYLSKYLDYFDTYFIILKRKEKQQLSFLHVYHHSTISLLWAFLVNNGHGNGTVTYCAFINSLIHFIMYSHYLVTSLGYKNPLKKIVTMSQIGQFYSCIIHSVLVLLYENIVPKSYAFLEFSYHISLIILFTNFYKKTYNINKLK